MLTKKQIEEIKEHLEKAQNPLFYYDNDADGLCSFLILRRYIGRGKGVAVKSYPDLNVQYAKKAQELGADYVFVLDKPMISKEFIDEIDKMQLPMVWIDHHQVDNKFDKKGYNNLHVYNPIFNSGKDKSSEPVTYLVYNLTKRKEDLWIAVMGCIADHYLPDYIEDFVKEHPDYWTKLKIKEPFDAYYNTEIGKIARAIGFGLKDSISRVVEMQNFLIKCRGPEDIFLESDGNKSFRERFGEIRKKYDILLERARENVSNKLIFFDYAGDLSISAEIANELSYLYKDKYICVAYRKGEISNISLRGNNVREILERVLGKIENASGGGHRDAVGARIKTADLSKFREILEKEIKNG